MYLIIGLGNPGKQYLATRHNIGFSAIDYLSQTHHIEVSKIKHKGILGEGVVCGQKVILLKPQTFMNLSGESVQAAASWYKIPNENIIVLYDDVSLPVGKLRIRTRGSAGGHNGIKSIISHLNSDEFGRIKIGVGAAQENTDLANHVLGHIPKNEQEILFETLGRCTKAIEEYITAGAQSAMNKYNG